MRINKEEWHDWREHPVTIAFFNAIRSEREEFLQRLASGAFSEEPGKQNLMIGAVNCFTKVLDADFVENS